MTHALVVSPIPSHPLTQGNAARIHSICRGLQARGYIVHFFYYQFEGLTAGQLQDMSEAWEFVYTLPYALPNREMTLNTHFAIDDWWDPRAGKLVSDLDATWHYELCVVNYSWFSAVLDHLPRRVRKVIDTHDVFADRHVRSREANLEPSWFYTSPEEEVRGLARADLVLAIQHEEEAQFRALGVAHVTTVGYLSAPRFLPARSRTGRLRVGYIGSANPWNVRSIAAFRDQILLRPDLADRVEFVLAGPICGAATAFAGPFTLLGTVPEPGDFYRQIDIVVNPMIGGTGLKIKTIEALGYGVALLSTRDGSLGIDSPYPEHGLDSIPALLDALERTVVAGETLVGSRRASRHVFAQYVARQQRAFDAAFPTPVSIAASRFDGAG